LVGKLGFDRRGDCSDCRRWPRPNSNAGRGLLPFTPGRKLRVPRGRAAPCAAVLNETSVADLKRDQAPILIEDADFPCLFEWRCDIADWDVTPGGTGVAAMFGTKSNWPGPLKRGVPFTTLQCIRTSVGCTRNYIRHGRPPWRASSFGDQQVLSIGERMRRL